MIFRSGFLSNISVKAVYFVLSKYLNFWFFFSLYINNEETSRTEILRHWLRHFWWPACWLPAHTQNVTEISKQVNLQTLPISATHTVEKNKGTKTCYNLRIFFLLIHFPAKIGEKNPRSYKTIYSFFFSVNRCQARVVASLDIIRHSQIGMNRN